MVHESPMPTIDQVCPYQDGVFAWQYLQILMCWPNDAEEQLQARRAFYLHNLGNAETKASTEMEYLQACMAFEPIRRELGGWSRMADAPAFSAVIASILERQKDGFIAGAILRLMHALRTQDEALGIKASKNKILDFLRIRGEGIFRQNRIFTRANLDEIWATYRPVAHLWAAHLSLHQKYFPSVPDKPGLSDPTYDQFDRDLAKYLHRLYCMARQLQEFGMTFKSKGTSPEKACLLDPENCHQLGEVPGWRDYVVPVFFFPEDWLDTFRAYQAPKAI